AIADGITDMPPERVARDLDLIGLWSDPRCVDQTREAIMTRSLGWLLLCAGCVISSGATQFAVIATDPGELAFESTAAGQSATQSATLTNQSSFAVRIRGQG